MANRYWVGGTANWDGTAGTKWSLTSGGPGGETVPTSADDVFFSAGSSGTCTISTGNTGAKSITCTGFTGTLAGSAAITVSGNITLVAGMTYSHAGTVTFDATATLTTAGKTFSGILINGSGITVTLADALSMGTRVITVNSGTFDTGNFNVTCGSLNSNGTGTRTITLGSSTVTLSNSLDFAVATNLTFNANTSQLTFTATAPSIQTGSQTFYNVSLTSTALTSPIFFGSATFNNLTVTARTSTGISTLYFAANSTQTINGILTINSGTNATRRTVVSRYSGTPGAIATLTCAAVASLADLDFRDITINGAAISGGNLTGTRLGNCGGNSGITFGAGVNKYWNLAGGGNWSATGWTTVSGNAPGINDFPLAQDTAIFEATGLNSGATITNDANWNIGGVNMSARTTNTMTWAQGDFSPNIHGNFIVGTGCSITRGTALTNFVGRNNQSFTSNGVSVDISFLFECPGSTFTCVDNITTSGTISIYAGTLYLGATTFTCGGFFGSGSDSRTIDFGTGNITLSGGNWNTATVTNLTIAGTPVVNHTYAGAVARSVLTGPLSESNAISFNFKAGTYSLTFLSIAGYTAKNVDFTGFAGTWAATSTGTIYGNLTLVAGMTLTASSSAMTFGATSGTQTITCNGKTIEFPVTINGAGGTVKPSDAMTVGSTRATTLSAGTLDLSLAGLTTGTFQSGSSSTRAIVFGTNVITVTNNSVNVCTVGGTGFSYTGTFNITSNYTGGTGTRSFTGGLIAANTYPTVATSGANINIGTAATDIVNLTGSWGNVDFTNFTRTLSNATRSLFGNLTISAGMTLTAGTLTTTFAGTSGTQDITTNGKTLDFPINFNGVGGTFRLQDALTMGATRACTHTNGTLNLNGKTLTVGTSYATAAGTKNLTFDGGTLVCPAATTTAFNNAQPTNYTTTAGTGTGKISMTAATGKTFVGGGSTYNCTLSNDGAGALTLTGSNTFTTLANGVQPTTFTFTAGTATTVTNWNVSGTAGSLVTIGSATAASHTLSKSSGIVSAQYLSISRSTATGGATWYAVNSTNGGNNSGWNFVASPPGAFFQLFL